MFCNGERKSQLFIMHFAHSLTQNQPAKYPFKPNARHSSRKGVFAKPRVLVSLLCLTRTWTIFGLDFKAAHRSHCTEVVLCELLCEVHITQLLLTLSLPTAEHANCFVVEAAIFRSSGTYQQQHARTMTQIIQNK
jgi:hypothetical protein